MLESITLGATEGVAGRPRCSSGSLPRRATDAGWSHNPWPRKGNQTAAAVVLLCRVDLEGAMFTADTPHSESETARPVVQERRTGCLLAAKGKVERFARNEPKSAEVCRTFFLAEVTSTAVRSLNQIADARGRAA